MEDFDIVVIGLGIMGRAAAYHCARRGARTLGLDAHDKTHDLGSSHGTRRATRETYFESPDYVPLAQRAFDQWRSLEAESGDDLFTVNGAVYVAPDGHAMLQGVERAARAHGLPFTCLSRAQTAARFPAFDVPQGWQALVEQRGGVLRADRCMQTLANLAQHHGAELRFRQPALRISQGPRGKAIVQTPNGPVSASKVIMTVGPWSGGSLTDLGLPLSVRRKVLVHLEPDDPASCPESSASVFFWAAPEGVFGGFLHREGEGVMAARHDGGELCLPDTVNRKVTTDDIDEVASFFAKRIPGAKGPLLKARVCLYTTTPDGHFVVDRHRDHANLVYAAGFNGHGFKFAPVIGESLADLALDDTTINPIGFLAASRFAQAA